MMQAPTDRSIRESIRQIHFFLSGYIEGQHADLDKGALQKWEGLDPSHLESLDCVLQYLDELAEQPRKLTEVEELSKRYPAPARPKGALDDPIPDMGFANTRVRKPNTFLKARIIRVFGTASDFAAEIDEHESLVSKVVWGRRKLDAARQKKWAKALKCKPKDIFKQERRS